MSKRLLLIVIGCVFLAACAKPPVAELDEARNAVARAYAAGASQLAADLYQSAEEALQAAEEQVRSGEYRAAERSLQVARIDSGRALSLTEERKQQLEEEQKKRAEEKRLAARRAELERLKRLAEKSKESTEQQKPEPSIKPQVVEKPVPVKQVTVVAGENLMTIAGRPEVYDEGNLWPLIYKANRDQIKDPKQVFPGQVLTIPRDQSAEEVEAARKEARQLQLF